MGRGLEQVGSQPRSQVLGPPAAAGWFPEWERVLEEARVGIRGALALVLAAGTGLSKGSGGRRMGGKRRE